MLAVSQARRAFGGSLGREPVVDAHGPSEPPQGRLRHSHSARISVAPFRGSFPNGVSPHGLAPEATASRPKGSSATRIGRPF